MNRDYLHDGKCVATGRRAWWTLELALATRGPDAKGGAYRCDFCGGWHVRRSNKPKRRRSRWGHDR